LVVHARILVFAGSIRTGAYSAQAADAATKVLASLGAEATRISLADYPLPIMNQDLERSEGVPENAMRLGRMIDAQDGLLIATPEYNASIPPLLKNAIDWVSRITRDSNGKPFKPFDGKVAALCSSSNGKYGGVRALNHLRPICMNVGLEVITPQCAISAAKTAFDSDGTIADERTRRQMEKTCTRLIEHAKLLSRRNEA
jgi:NAD(P)H-dependent FMN reductase